MPVVGTSVKDFLTESISFLPKISEKLGFYTSRISLFDCKAD
jgi:hypothetical protein